MFPNNIFGSEGMWDNFSRPAKESVKEGIADGFKGLFKDMGEIAIQMIPDFMGYATIFCGAFIILGAMVSKKAMFRPAGILAGGLIVAVCVLEAA